MRNRTILSIFVLFCFLTSRAQNDCDKMMESARQAMANQDYSVAIKLYKRVLDRCGDYKGVSKELQRCQKTVSDMNAVFLLAQTKLECGGEGGTLVMELKKAPADWAVIQCPEWLRVAETHKEEKRVWFRVETNPRAEKRKGVIRLRSDKGKTQDFTVVQGKGEENLAVQTDHLSFENGGGSQTVVVDANFNWGYGISDSWIQLNKRGDGKLLVTCAYNAYPKERKATITVFGEDVTRNIDVIQFAGDTYFSVAGTTDSVILFRSSGGKNNKLRVSCNDEWNVTNDCSWLDVTRYGDAIIVRCQPNPWAERRSASFEVVTVSKNHTKTILVEQGGTKPVLNKISLPSKSGERSVYSVRPHYRSLYLKGNGGDLVAKVHSNIQSWHYNISPDDVNWITDGGTVPQDSLLKLHLYDNNGWMERDADVVITAMGFQDTIHIRQNVRGYKGLLEDYFEGSERTWKTTNFFLDLYGAESVGLRIGGWAKRWKFVEISLLDFDVEYAYRVERAYQDVVQAFHVDWEPIVRGYLPLSRDGRRWAAYMGVGIAVNLFSLELSPNISYYYKMPNFLFEIGAEFNWIKNDNVSSRVFYRYDGYSSVGISFDFYKWTKKW